MLRTKILHSLWDIFSHVKLFNHRIQLRSLWCYSSGCYVRWSKSEGQSTRWSHLPMVCREIKQGLGQYKFIPNPGPLVIELKRLGWVVMGVRVIIKRAGKNIWYWYKQWWWSKVTVHIIFISIKTTINI